MLLFYVIVELLFVESLGNPVRKSYVSGYSSSPYYDKIRPLGCYVDKKYYRPGSHISSGNDGDKWCFGVYCDENGQKISWDDFKCKINRKTTTMPTKTSTTTSTTKTTTLFGCYYDGQFYWPGSDISSESSGNWCYGRYCDTYGNIIHWDNFQCNLTPTTTPITTTAFRTTTTHTTTLPPTTTTKTPTASLGCHYEGKFYLPESAVIFRNERRSWCYGIYCGKYGNSIKWRNFRCYENPSTTRATTTTTPITPFGCFYKGKFYSSGSVITAAKIGENSCYGSYCDTYGNIINLDKFQCNLTPTTTPPTTTTFETTTTPKTTTMPTKTSTTTSTTKTTTLFGCYYDGQFYWPGSDISSGSSGNWCYGRYCDTYGNIIHWDNFQCNLTPTTTPITTTAFRTTTTHTTTLPPTTTTKTPTASLGCHYEGKFYLPESAVIFRNERRSWCYGIYCGKYGNSIKWRNFRCYENPSTTRATTTTTPITSFGCFYKGKFYSSGSVITAAKIGENSCYGSYCDTYGNIINLDKFQCNLTPTTTPTTTTTFETTTTPTTTTTFETTTTHTTIIPTAVTTTTPTASLGCHYEGKFYLQGSAVISRNKRKSWCYGIYCGKYGNSFKWNTFQCYENPSTTRATTTTTTTTTPFSFSDST